MNREQEHLDLLHELSCTPPALEGTIMRAKERAKKRNAVRGFVVIPLTNIVGIFIVFVLLVNLFPNVAYAMERIPGLRRLAAAVSFSPSLTAAVEHEFVQHMGLEQTLNGITMRVEYIIVDQRQLNVFYTLDSEIYFDMDARPTLLDAEYIGFVESFGMPRLYTRELRRFTADFPDGMPERVVFEARVSGSGANPDAAGAPVLAPPAQWDPFAPPPPFVEPETIATFVFTLEFDPTFTEQGEILILNYDFTLDGQRLTITTVEIYPSHMRVNIIADENNTAQLSGMRFYFEDEQGQRFYRPSGIISTSCPITGVVSYRLESAFFAQSESFTMLIEEAEWLDEGMERVRVDLYNGTADRLPDGVRLELIERRGNSWNLTFSAHERHEGHMHQLFLTSYFDEAGNEYWRNVTSASRMTRFDSVTGRYEHVPGVFEVFFSLHDYPYDVVYLSPAFSRFIRFETPVAILVK